MSIQKYIIDFDGTSGQLTIGAGSVSAALPPNTEHIGLACTGNCHVHIGAGSAVATSNDPVLTPYTGFVVLTIGQFENNSPYLAVIQDGASTGILSYFRVKQG
jgi:hypothetical protein